VEASKPVRGYVAGFAFREDPAEGYNEDVNKAQRKKARASWSITTGPLSDEESIDYSSLSPEQRMAEVFALSSRVWRLSGRSFPKYSRSTMPGRCTGLGDAR
jgi:hypothetical protein